MRIARIAAPARFRRHRCASTVSKVGMVGLGAMGTPMCENLMAAGYQLTVCDSHPGRVEAMVAKGATAAATPAEAASGVDAIVTMVPNDAVLKAVTCDRDTGLLRTFGGGVHVSCSTVHPDTSRELAALHAEAGSQYVGAPIFARADGVANRLASFVVGGEAGAIATARPLLEANANGVFEFGDDPGAGNVVKICGNYMIASTIQTCAEALSLAEKSGLDRQAVMTMLNTTIFDCLIHRGYGDRVAQRSHVPGEPLVGPGFQLELGLKDVTLVCDVARKVQAPMPVATLLHDRLLAAAARGRGQLDWSAVALSASEEAGVDVSHLVPPQKGSK
eukprot:Transcript_20939.p2 GENE.Transcript_20939~~Transcript_20939.p2  ORF type:complete len:333 (+),score=134.76 Transcript_20939:209-1207(+)